jgi:signal transduction histidine kinase
MSTQPQFLTSISHELKNQIVPIFSLSEMIKDQFFGKIDDVKNKKEYLEAAEDIHNAAQEMLEFLNDLMDMAFSESGDFSVNLENVDLANLIERSIKINKDLALRKNIQIVFNRGQSSLPNITLDPRRTKQILINLISNSVKYSPENTTITINTRIENNNKLTISIQDQGIGMNTEQIQMALDGKGTQIDKSALKNHHYQTQHHKQTHSHKQTQTQIDSHGIGMPLVKKLVELQNGEMKILSKIEEGTEIILCFNC